MHTYQVLTKRAERLYELHDKLNWTTNIWMGVSVENDKVKDRIDFLRETNAKVKFLSLEPLIGPLTSLNLEHIHWAIVGGGKRKKSQTNERIMGLGYQATMC
jgi:protein gp37